MEIKINETSSKNQSLEYEYTYETGNKIKITFYAKSWIKVERNNKLIYEGGFVSLVKVLGAKL